MTNNYSVLMSVYYKEQPEYLYASMLSIYEQTQKTDDFILVCDGPLGTELNKVIDEMKQIFGTSLKVIRLKENVGLGKALNKGIAYCKNDIVARMDSDDISYPDRCEKQIQVFEKYPHVSICSGIVEEFSDNINNTEARRVLPEHSDEILQFAKHRNPFNHPCVMYRKAAVEEAGGYQDFYLLEDYYLWLRMLIKGMHGYNLQEPLLHMRAGANMYHRRAGWKYVRTQQKLFRYMKEQQFISTSEYWKSIIIRSGSALVPNKLRKFMYKKFVRK